MPYDPTILARLEQLPDCSPGNDAISQFGAEFRDIANPDAFLKDRMTNLIRHYHLDTVGIPLPRGNYEICFHHYDPEIVDVDRPDGTVEQILQVARASTEKELFEDGSYRFDAIWISDVFRNPNEADPLSDPERVPSKFIHELAHVVGMIARIPDEDHWTHGPDFQLIRVQLQRITGIDIPIV
ncbi:hypothetical protein DdX_21374 [Ditylenchus destructor]|uniref:Uncharacterized protein n=1 Tax=Ditylenchus destructor TaxID=166010 RepID=A0AAD4QVC0_9BILA|nr:hypothetical protein DdX_21374 [Ditylenchus destructor]